MDQGQRLKLGKQVNNEYQWQIKPMNMKLHLQTFEK